MSDDEKHDKNAQPAARRTFADALAESRERKAEPPEADVEDKVDLASADSMDASDPPSFTPTKAGASTHKKP